MDLTCFNWVQLVKKSDLPANAKYLALYLGTFMNAEHDVAWPSQLRISNETGLSKPTVIKWLDYLDRHQWLIKRNKAREIKTAGGVQLQNEYLINIPEKVVKEINLLTQGGKAVGQRGLNESSKGVKQLNTNNNSNNNSNNKKEKPFVLPEWMDAEAWQSFVDHRKQLKAPMTNRAKTLIINKFIEYGKQGQVPQDLINQSIENGWKGIFPIKEKSSGTHQQDNRSRAKRVSDKLDQLAQEAIDRGETI